MTQHISAHMTAEEFKNIHQFVMDESRSWPESQKLRAEFEMFWQSYFTKVPVNTLEEAGARGFMVISHVLEILKDVMDFDTVDPGHGIGHLIRDYIHASILTQKLHADPRQAYIGFVGGTLHDFLGCTLIDRYTEGKRVVRHAEAGGLLFMEISKRLDITHDEAILIYYAIAAHTNYLRPVNVLCTSDSITREITPYIDMEPNGAPLMSVNMSRWVDRLDVSGPCFVGRHYLTMAEEHEDYAEMGGHHFFKFLPANLRHWFSLRFGTGRHYTVTFTEHMRPLLRDKAEITKDPTGSTMREHLAMFANSQTNTSPFGRFDHGYMITLRDKYKDSALRIIDTFDHPIQLSDQEAEELLNSWTEWLSKHIEPSRPGHDAAIKLQELFITTLSQDVKNAWYSAMRTTLEEYKNWSHDIHIALSQFHKERLTLPTLGDVRDII